MRRFRLPTALAVITLVLSLVAQSALTQPPGSNHAGQGLIIELDNQFIEKYENRATITSDHTIFGISANHPAASDGEVHIGGWVHEAGLPGVVEIMNVATKGKAGAKACRDAGAMAKISVTGAWRIWGEHAGTGPQVQKLDANAPSELSGEFPSNPDHVFEIHPVTSVKINGHETATVDAIGATQGFSPHDATKAFHLGYETLTCKIIPKNGRTRIVTQALGFNFTEFIIRLGENPFELKDDQGKPDGHGVICSVSDPEGELLVKHRRMVFLPGTAADAAVKELKKGDRLQVIGIPRISLKLLNWRLKHQDGKDDDGKPFDTNPLEWGLPYEMIIVSAKPAPVNDD